MTAIQEALGTTATLDDVFAMKADGRWVLCWDLTGSTLYGLTPDGLSRALAATGKWIDGLSDAGKAAFHHAAPRVTVGVTGWQIPFVAGQENAVRTLMQTVLHQPGSLGRLA